MAQSKKLAKSQKQTVESDDLWRWVIEELKSNSDRDIALAGASWVHDSLALYIKSRLNLAKKETERTLFGTEQDHEGWASRFSVQVHLGRALNLYGDKTFSDLNHIRKIRNIFAHEIAHLDNQREVVPVRFTTPQIRDNCRNLKVVEDSIHPGSAMAIGPIVIDQTTNDPAELYRRTVAYLCFFFRQAANETLAVSPTDHMLP